MKNKAISVGAWALCLALAYLLLFVLARQISAVVIATAIFAAVAFVVALIVLLTVGRRGDDPILHRSSVMVAMLYMVVQIPICIIFALLYEIVTLRVTILIQGILLILALLIILGSIAGNDSIRAINSRQQDHHTSL